MSEKIRKYQNGAYHFIMFDEFGQNVGAEVNDDGVIANQYRGESLQDDGVISSFVIMRVVFNSAERKGNWQIKEDE